MKTRSILLVAILIAATLPAFAQSTSGMQSMEMDQNMPGMNHAAKTAQGVGVIEAVDRAKGTVTIKHQAIASIHWPAMTMTFKADPPSLLKDVRIGEKVNFTLHPTGMHGTVTEVVPAE